VRPLPIELEAGLVKVPEFRLIQEARFQRRDLLPRLVPRIDAQGRAPLHPLVLVDLGRPVVALHLPQQEQDADVLRRIHPQLLVKLENAWDNTSNERKARFREE